jgi:hypothetical protein
MFANARLFSLIIITLNYALALFGVFAWSLQAPVGDFWHIDGQVAVVVCFEAVAMHILMYFDESFGLRTQE